MPECGQSLVRRSSAVMLQNWRDTSAKRAFGYLRSFALAHTMVQEVPRNQGIRDQRRAQRDSKLDQARDHLLEYARIAETVSWLIRQGYNKCVEAHGLLCIGKLHPSPTSGLAAPAQLNSNVQLHNCVMCAGSLCQAADSQPAHAHLPAD